MNAVTCRNGEEPDRRGAGRGGDPTAQRTSETGRGDQARPALEAAIRAVMPASSCLHTAAIRAVMSAHCLGESRIGADENTHSQQRPTLARALHSTTQECFMPASERRASNEAVVVHVLVCGKGWLLATQKVDLLFLLQRNFI